MKKIKFIFTVLFFVFFLSPCFAGYVYNPFTSRQDAVPTIEEEDASPTLTAINKIKFPNGSVTNNGDGSASISFSSGFAPNDGTYLTLSNNASLSAERVLTEGLAIDFSDTGADGTLTVAFDPTELTGNRTWSDGSGASAAWTWNLTGTDPVLTAVSGGFDVTGDFDVSSTIEAGSGNITLTNATGNIDGEIIADDTIDDDSIDFADVTGADLTLTDAGAITASGKIIANASLDVKNGATSSGVLAIFEDSDDGTNKATFQVPALAADTVYVLPADDGDAGEQLQTDGSGGLTWEAAGSAVATKWNAIADADADGSVDFMATEQDIIGQLDGAGKYILTLTNQDADTANDTGILSLAANDGADANVIYLSMIGDADGTPTTDFLVRQSATGITMNFGSAGVVLSDDGDGALTILGAGNGTDENLIFNFDDTPDTVSVSSGTGVADFDFGTIDVNTDTLDLTGTGTINGLDAIDSTTETTLEGAIDIAGDISGTGLTAVTIGADKVLESHLKAVDAASDEDILTFESTTGDFEWHIPSELITAGDYIDWSGATLNVVAGSTTVVGAVEVAIASEVDTGTDTARAISPDALAGSNLGEKIIQMVVFDFTTNTATGDGKFYCQIPSSLDGMNLVEVHGRVITAGTTNTTDVQINNVTQAADMLSTKLTIDSAETDSSTAASAAVIDTNNDDVAANDLLRVDFDAVSTTPAKGYILTLIFRLP